MAENLSNVPLDPPPPSVNETIPPIKTPFFRFPINMPALIAFLVVLAVLGIIAVSLSTKNTKPPIKADPNSPQIIEKITSKTNQKVKDEAKKKEKKEDKTQKKLRKDIKKVFKDTKTDQDILKFLQLIRDEENINKKYDYYVKTFKLMKESYKNDNQDSKKLLLLDLKLYVKGFANYKEGDFTLGE